MKRARWITAIAVVSLLAAVTWMFAHPQPRQGSFVDPPSATDAAMPEDVGQASLRAEPMRRVGGGATRDPSKAEYERKREAILREHDDRLRAREAYRTEVARNRKAAKRPNPELTDFDKIRQLQDQVLDLLEGCLDGTRDLLPPGRTSIVVNVTVAGEPDIGSLVTDVEVTARAQSHPELDECLTESLYLIELDPPDDTLLDVIEIGLTVVPPGTPAP